MSVDMKFFEYSHLPEPLKRISADVHDLAWSMSANISNGPELQAGLRKLLEAKDCFV